MNHDADTIRVYADRRSDYEAIEPSEIERRSIDGFLGRLPAGGHILDLGCGPGRHAARMIAAGFTVTAIDATPEFVSAARARGVDARLATFDDICERDAYDGVWANFSLLHAPRSAFAGHLDAIHAALKPGGALFLGLKLGAGEKRDALGRFYAYYSEQELRDHLRAAGFTPVQVVHGEARGLAGTSDPFILMTARG